MRVLETTYGFDLLAPNGECLLRHTSQNPCIMLGTGTVDFAMHRGNFKISKNDGTRVPVILSNIKAIDAGKWQIEFEHCDTGKAALVMHVQPNALSFDNYCPEAERFALRLHALPQEAVWGCGMQYSYLNLRGRCFPIWASEPGVGRDKSSWLTQKMDEEGGAGGDFWTTGYPQPTFLSSRGYAVHIDSSAYAEFDFSDAATHVLTIWDTPAKLELFWGDNPADIVSQLSARFGPQTALPDWTLKGAVIGLKQGLTGFERLESIEAAGTSVTGLWCEDWVGLRETSFGKRLFWDWRVDEVRYPKLKERIAGLRERGIRFLGYVNPYLCVDGSLYAEAKNQGFFVRRLQTDEAYIVDFGEFECGIIDLTNPEARHWFASRIIGEEMIGLGMSGWMADFGEYLPTDAKLFDGSDAKQAHNFWPVLWGQVNAEAVELANLQEDVVFFMRSGGSGLPRHAPLIWAGDQSVDFSRHDGIGTALTAALSAGLTGNGHVHSDIGGYTSLHGNIRSAELMMRWAEMAVFTPFMRTHEGNRPDDNLQIDSDALVLDHFAAMTRLHTALTPYAKEVSRAVAERGLPMQRAMFLHCEEREVWSLQDQYFFGLDLLVAPALEEGIKERRVYVPSEGTWYDFWNGNEVDAGSIVCPAPFGLPPVFVRKGNKWSNFFDAAAAAHLDWHKYWTAQP